VNQLALPEEHHALLLRISSLLLNKQIKDEDLLFALTTLAAKISPVLAFSTEIK